MIESASTIKIDVAYIAFWGAVTSAAFSLLGGLAGSFIASRRAKLRDQQDKEVEWRNHAIELTKLDAQRLLELRKTDPTRELRPLILTFLANYRNLQDLNTKTPKEVYESVRTSQLSKPKKPPVATQAEPGVVACNGTAKDHPKIFLLVESGKSISCPYCGQNFTAKAEPAGR